ncbi:hypothetical protein ACO0QE_001633 [Hanseniaspora vineae]
MNQNSRSHSGILKNRNEKPLVSESLSEDKQQHDLAEFRKKVYENTILNSKLTSNSNQHPITKRSSSRDGIGGSPGGVHIPKDSLELKLEQQEAEHAKETNGNGTAGTGAGHESDLALSRARTEEELLKWNKQNLADNEIAKKQYQDIHIDEPKTPYQGAVDPNGEYYTIDDDDNENFGNFQLNDPDGSFSLGEPEVATKPSQPKNVGLVKNEDVDDGDGDDDEEEEEEKEGNILTPEERHRKFEEMRKKHYNIKDVLRNKAKYEEDEEDDDDEDEE